VREVGQVPPGPVPAVAGPARVLVLAMVEALVPTDAPCLLRPPAAQRRSLAMAVWMPSSSTVSPVLNASMASRSR
jgi:hypothetical protein